MTRMMTAALALALCCAATIHAQSDRASAKTASQATAQVNLNTATQAQLEALPGVGARTAALIIEYRQKSGGFKKVEDLMNVKGVGEKSFLKLKSLITVGGSRE